MNLSQNAQKIVFDNLCKPYETPTLIVDSTILLNNNEKEKRLIVMTQFSIFLFFKENDSIKLDDKNYFYYIRSIKKSKGRYRLRFADKSFTFVGQSAEFIAQMAVCQVQNIFIEVEMNDISQSLLPAEKYFPSILNRFLARMIAKNNVPPLNFIESFKKSINGIQQTFDLGEIESSDKYLDGILISLIIAPNIKHLIIPYTNNPKFWTIVGNYVVSSTQLEWITVSNQPGPKDQFENFFNILQKDSSLTFYKLEFKGVIFNKNMLNSLISSLSTKIITELIFNGCGFDMQEHQINDLFFNIQKRTRLNLIGFSSWYFENRNELLEKIYSIGEISLQGIDLEINRILDSIQSTRCFSLNLSSTAGLLPLNQDVKLPIGLKKLYLNNVKWSGQVLTKIIKLCSEHKNPMTLELANIQINDNEKQFFEKSLNNLVPGSIEAFVWNNNFLSQSIKSFIMKGENLNFLGLAGIDFYQETEFLKQLNVECLDIHGTKTKLRESVPEVLQSLSQSKVKFINISHNAMGISLLPQLENVLLKYTNLRHLVKLKDFANKMTANKKLHIYFPWYEIYKLCLRSVPATAINLKKFFYISSTKKNDSLSAEEWEKIANGYYPENDFAESIDNITPIECPNSDYNPYPEEEDEESEFEEKRDIWNLDIIKPPENIIEKLQSEVEESQTISKLLDSLINSSQI